MTKRSNFEVGEERPLNGHQRRRRETRRMLLQAGRALFAERGVENTSIDAITAEAGVAKGSFYNHFESREALFEDVLDHVMQDQQRHYREFDPGIDDPLEQAMARSRFGFQALLGDPEACRLLMQAGPARPGTPVERGIRLSMQEEIRASAGLGAFSDLDPDLVYAAYFGVITQTIGLLLERGDDLDPEEGAEQVTRLCFAVLGLPAAGS